MLRREERQCRPVYCEASQAGGDGRQLDECLVDRKDRIGSAMTIREEKTLDRFAFRQDGKEFTPCRSLGSLQSFTIERRTSIWSIIKTLVKDVDFLDESGESGISDQGSTEELDSGVGNQEWSCVQDRGANRMPGSAREHRPN